ncbi:hypothetical protein DH2020_020438 [Rehmannia glutinosa]|uniref:Transmembrane protein n=1 Tax=Rehmannia glutinosa TaxID=99300 RepID=A0ABR0WKF0_REHGL
MAADQNSRKKSKKHRFRCFSFKSCFGLVSHEEPKPNMEEKNDDEKLVKYGTRKPSRARTVPISHPTSFVVETVEKSGQLVAPQPQQVTNNKVHHDIVKKNKNLCQSSGVMGSIKIDKKTITQETWSSPVKLLHSVSLPPPPRPKKGKSTAGGGGSEKEAKIDGSDELDPMVGALIMAVTLIVMLIWGKLCAVICTAVWFYIIPRFRANNGTFYVNKLKNSSKNIDVGSWEYKKKVVLEGFLERY